ncbi:MAG: ABC-F type ribosomal protection protein [Clostridia bacterium]|nr:ABC-F type ribosomal protection protein [Clostridia bacterium]
MEYGDRLLFEIDNASVYHGEKIGIVGSNGAGKTTLMEIMSKRIIPTQGKVMINPSFSYIPQLDEYHHTETSAVMKQKWDVPDCPISGGEITRLKIAEAFSDEADILLCDEPTCNLDQDGIVQLENAFKSFKGTLVLISHDRKLLDEVCDTIWEIEDEKLSVFKGNYSDYMIQKEYILKQKQESYEKYMVEKDKLHRAILERNKKANSMKKTPKRMGNSEARLHKMEVRQRAGKIEQAATHLKSRLDKLETVDKPKSKTVIRMSADNHTGFVSRNAVTIENLNVCFGENVVLSNVSLLIEKSSKVALTGNNGSGKTTLMNCIYENRKEILIAPGAKISYFRQNYSNLSDDNCILDEVLENSRVPEYMARIILARLGIRTEEVYKKIGVLSGGERSRVSLALILCEENPIMLLDEPTNYLDIQALEALEEMLIDYKGTLLFVSHDRYFREKIATRTLIVNNGMVIDEERLDSKSSSASNDTKLLLEMEKAKLISRLTFPEKGDIPEDIEKRYMEVIRLLEELK